MITQEKVTIRDIARRANVSASTVSRVLNGTTPVKESKRQAVMAAVRELNYQPDIMARSLAQGKSMTIGILTPDIASPFFGEVLKGIEQGLQTNGYYPIFASGSWHKTDAVDRLDVLIKRRVDGLIVLWNQLPDQTLHQVAQKMPLVIIGHLVPGLETQCLLADDYQGAYTATRYLLDLGHRRIAHITGILSHQDSRQRHQGYQDALTQAGHPIHKELIVEGDFSAQSGVMAVEILLTRAPAFTAIFIANDQMAHGVCLALSRRGIRVPEDVSLVGFDDEWGSAFMIPPLTTIRLPRRQLGETAASAICHWLAKEPFQLPTLPTELIIRKTAIHHR